MKYKSMTGGMMTILQEEGLSKGVFKGLTACLLREGTYSGMRLGFYEPIKKQLGAGDDSRNTPNWIRFTAGGLAGLVSSGIVNPCDLVKVRMQG